MHGETTVITDPIDEFIGEQLRSTSNIDPTITRKERGKKPFRWWPYAHIKESRSMKLYGHEDRLIDALDRKYRRGRRRQDRLEDLLGKGYTKKEAALLLGVDPKTVQRDVKKIRRRLQLWKPKTLQT